MKKSWSVFGGVFFLLLLVFMNNLIHAGWFFGLLFWTFGFFLVRQNPTEKSWASTFGFPFVYLGSAILLVSVIAYFA